jgi:hypothetical protein
LDICGKAITFAGRSLKDCPFRHQKLKSLLSKCVIMENIKLLSKQLKLQYMEQNVVMALINDIEIGHNQILKIFKKSDGTNTY